MEGKKLYKFVYEDSEKTKVIRGYILENNEFEYKIQAERTNSIIILGKRAIIKVEVSK